MQSRGGGATHDVGVDLGSSSNTAEEFKRFAHTTTPLYGSGLNYSSMPLSPNYVNGYGYGYGAWTFGPPLMPLPPLLPYTSHGRGLLSRPLASLGVQGGGVLKKNSQGALAQGRGHTRGHTSVRFNRGGRGGKSLTKEALDADLDEWRLKDKRYAGQSLDAELDNYWTKCQFVKVETECNQGNQSAKVIDS
ncbi:hypothetical protein GOP47_0021555 [Adiantum capillus-veneris]|uniref:Chromatin target of PRMT1 protein C-terminal domain-containing protein n=1 Tax=Adiantum capillus-veneris TaxID=13818 RepID=A0A9D4Z5D0_ADICA|nr:hypothetical protein GOP47_0021555 [Adiantum capillus-veneris]